MLKNALTYAVITLLLNLTCYVPIAAQSKLADEAKRVTKIKARIAKASMGPKARVDVRLVDETRIQGYVREAGDSSFVMVEAKTNAVKTVEYVQVREVRKNLSAWTKLTTGLVVAGAVFGTLLLIGLLCRNCD